MERSLEEILVQSQRLNITFVQPEGRVKRARLNSSEDVKQVKLAQASQTSLEVLLCLLESQDESGRHLTHSTCSIINVGDRPSFGCLLLYLRAPPPKQLRVFKGLLQPLFTKATT
jgi:hypothetical protein